MIYRNCFIVCILYLLELISSVPLHQLSNVPYIDEREALLKQDLSLMLGYELTLNHRESVVNGVLMANKTLEYFEGFHNLDFPPSSHFFKNKDKIEETQTFQFIRNMPKGAALHLHDMALTSVDWMVSNLTYWENLYMCTPEGSSIIFKFFLGNDSTCDWQLVSDARESFSSVEEFDDVLHTSLSLFTPVPEVRYPDINSMWKSFENIFISLSGLISNKDSFKAYYYQAMTEFMEDNISYFEFRGVLSQLYELDGTLLSPEDTIKVYKEVNDDFIAKNPSFYGTKYIYAPPRLVTEDQVYKYVDLMIRLKALFPDYVIGFDLVGQEDLGLPLINFINPLLQLGQQQPPIPVFYHAGETDWQGTSSDENLFDALLLNSTRIGHGYAITKHPALLQKVRQADVPIEVCPLSNQILLLVNDLRNHPASSLMATSFPLVVSSDDPSLWEALPLSHDLYEAFMGLGGAHADLKFLKKLALNSIKYSSLSDVQKEELTLLWQQNWNNYISSLALEITNDVSELGNDHVTIYNVSELGNDHVTNIDITITNGALPHPEHNISVEKIP